MRRSSVLLRWHAWPALLALLLLAAAFAVYVRLEKRIDAENGRRERSLQLATLLRQSSDDLTRMARTAVLTGEARYEQAFRQIAAIRDGEAPWPEGYEGPYWDLLLAPGGVPGRPGPRVPLLQRLRDAGYSEAEFALLAEAKQHSDRLIERERRAMDLARSGDPAQREEAARLLHDPEYHAAKAAIMAPIERVQRLVQQRTAAAVAEAVQRADQARALLIGVGLLLAVLLLRAQWRLRRLLGGPAARVHERLQRLGAGDFDQAQSADDAEAPAGSVLADIEQARRELHRAQAGREAAERRLQLSAAVFTHAREGIMINAPDGRIVEVNDAFCRLTGYSREELIGKSPELLRSGRHEPAFYAAMVEQAQRHGEWQGEIWDRRKNGELFASLQTVSALRDAQGEVSHFIALLTDITALKEQSERLQHIAHYDALTGLPNRVLLGDRLKQAMSLAPRHGLRIAVCYLDLDGFKAVNDAHGHEAGDRLLVLIAKRLRGVLREGDTLARLGGDEFIVVLLDLPDVATCELLLQRMLRELAQPQVLDDDLHVQVSASVGVSFFPQAAPVDADQLLRQADQAMYQAKLAGKNRHHYFDADEAELRRDQLVSVAQLREALALGQFRLHYQPKVNLRSGQVQGVEALIRWQHPERGLLAPAAFLPLVEAHPLIADLGAWVLSTGLSQLAAWAARGLRLQLSVNIGALHLQQPDFCEQVLGLLRHHPQLQAQDLVIELTESSALDDLAGVSAIVAAGRARGLQFALDDFGTGYASLTYLRRLPVSQLKIDQSFVRDMLDDAEDLAILEGVIGLAAAFRRELVAEGVESVDHGAVLLQLGCELAQGYGIARPMPPEALPDWVAVWRSPVAWQGLRALGREQLPLLRARLQERTRGLALQRWLDGEASAPPPPEPGLLDQWLAEAPLLPRLEKLRERHRALQLLRRVALERGPAALEPAGHAALAAAEAALQRAAEALLR